MSDIEAIRSDEELAVALARADQLMDAAPGSPEEEELDALVCRIEAYEARRFPMGTSG